MNSKLIYLACPYSGNEEQSFEIVTKFAAKLMKDGQFVFSPITHCHPIAKIAKLPTTFDYWAEYDELMIKGCNELWVLCLDNWEKSKGVKAEIEIAKKINIPIKYLSNLLVSTSIE